MPSRTRSKREQRDALTRQLRAEGQSWAQIAARIRAGEHVNKRVAMRLAHGWTQWEVARRWNERWPAEDGGAGITGQVISYWETWPQSGREPSVKTLCRLALLYECDVTDLIDKENYIGPGDPRHAGEEPRSGAAVAAGLAPSLEEDAGIEVAGAPPEIAGAQVPGWWAKVPAPVRSGFAYRWRTEPGLGGSATEREVLMAAHEGGEHAESAERRDIGDATLEQMRADLVRLSHDYMRGEPLSLFRAGWAYAVAIDHRPLMAQLRLQLASIASWDRPRQSREHAARGLEYLSDGPNAAQLHLLFGRAAVRLGDAEAARHAITA